jgi:hypothetical protein
MRCRMPLRHRQIDTGRRGPGLGWDVVGARDYPGADHDGETLPNGFFAVCRGLPFSDLD